MAATLGSMAVVNTSTSLSSRAEKSVSSSFLGGHSAQRFAPQSAFGRVSFNVGGKQGQKMAQRIETRIMAKDLHFNKDGSALKKMQAHKLADLVGVTLGPKERSVVLDNKYGSPKIVNDRVTVAKEVELEDPVEKIGAKLVTQAAGKTNDLAFDGSTPSVVLAQGLIAEGVKLEVVEPDFYRMGYIRQVRAYGVEFKEGPAGIGVYSAKSISYLEKPRVIMEIPMELMVTVSKELPWMFHPDIVPLGHPIFEVINATIVETDWDVRLACLLLLALDKDDNFWQLYGDYLPGVDDSTSLLLASEEELAELQDTALTQQLAELQQRSEATWHTYWPADAALKLKRLARDPGRFRWALGTVWSRSFTMTMTIGSKVQDAHMLIPYADMINHSFQPTCSYRWRKRDRMLEVVINACQTIHAGDEMTFSYMEKSPNSKFMQLYGFSSATNPWDTVNFSGNSSIHLDSYLSSFNISGMSDEYYYNEVSAEEVDSFVDGAIIAGARTLPSWRDQDLPFLPSAEMRAACDLQQESRHLLDAYPTTLDEDICILAEQAEGRSPRWKAAIKYRIDRKSLIKKIIKSLDLYMERILY